MKTIKNFTFFFSKDDAFSNWYLRDFVVNGVTFNCGEQYMMFAKAKLFGDEEIAKKILAEPRPAEQKKLGRLVKGFDQAIWDKRCVGIMAAGLFHKFDQHADLKDLLLKTGSTILVEASKYDKVWGIGLDVNDPRATDPSKWLGKNLLGKVLTRVRERLLEKEPQAGLGF